LSNKQGYFFIRNAPYTDLAGYPVNLKAGYRISSADWKPDIQPDFQLSIQMSRKYEKKIKRDIAFSKFKALHLFCHQRNNVFKIMFFEIS
jgi:hypothetical protein